MKDKIYSRTKKAIWFHSNIQVLPQFLSREEILREQDNLIFKKVVRAKPEHVFHATERGFQSRNIEMIVVCI